MAEMVDFREISFVNGSCQRFISPRAWKVWRAQRRGGCAHTRTSCAGFTLVEMLVTMSVLVLLLSVVVPSFTGLVRQARASAALKRFSLDLEFARSEAHRQGLPVSLCSPESGDWARGWQVFVDTNGDCIVNNGERILRSQSALFDGGSFQTSDQLGALIIGRTGMAANLVDGITLTLSVHASDARSMRCVLINSAGREEVSKAEGGECA